jgi:hypothetical protein
MSAPASSNALPFSGEIAVSSFFDCRHRRGWLAYRHATTPALDPLPVWLSLRQEQAARLGYWRNCVHTPLSDKELNAIRKALVSGRPFGSADWQTAMAARLGLSMSGNPRGRPTQAARMN